MALKKFIKENFVLAVGLSLPVLLIVLFFVASVLPRSMAVPPQHKMLFITIRYDYQNPPPYNIDFIVRDGVLKTRLVRNSKPAAGQPYTQNYNLKKLMVYEGKTQSIREIPYDLSKLGEVADGTEVVLDELKDMTVDSSTKAPDGYEFNTPGYRSGGLAPFLFWDGGYRSGARITKGAVSFKIPDGGETYYPNDVQFVGWVVGKK